MIPIEKSFAFDDEIRTSMKLIKSGLQHLNNVEGETEVYFMSFLLLANGYEKLFKIVYCLYSIENNSKFPELKDFKKDNNDNGHNLTFLMDKIVDQCFASNTPDLDKDVYFLKNDLYLRKLINLLSIFSTNSRYYNLDVLIDNKKSSSKDIIQEWRSNELNMLKSDNAVLNEFESKYKNPTTEKINEANAIVKNIRNINIVTLERMTRSVCKQFVRGNLGDEGKRYQCHLNDFLFLRDDELGSKLYNNAN